VNIYEQKKLLDNEAQPEAYEREAWLAQLNETGNDIGTRIVSPWL
jgi:hypothetical protein